MTFWTEHCSECSYPACYTTCDLYERRPDGHCRTLKYGFHVDRSNRTVRPSSVRISAKKWASLDCAASLRQLPASVVSTLENILTTLSRAWRIPAMFGSSYVVEKYLRLMEKLGTSLVDRLAGGHPMPDCFLFQAHNPGKSGLVVTIRICNKGFDGTVPSYQNRLELVSGSNQHIIPAADFIRFLDPAKPVRVYLSFNAAEVDDITIFAADFVTLNQGIALQRQVPEEKELKDIKCVVWDLDNTVWQGIFLEGPEKLVVNETVVAMIKELDRRGVVNSIASKNNHDDVIQHLKQLDLEQYFVFPEIGWEPKSASIDAIARNINIGLNTIAFVDDNPFELNEVKSRLPEVTVINVEEVGGILSDPRFKGENTEESAKRRSYYKAEESRKLAVGTFRGNYREFLLSCNINMKLIVPTVETKERMYELIQRTNQLNFTGKRYTLEEIEHKLNDPSAENLLIRCWDDYGEYGIVGYCCYSRSGEVLYIHELAFSCRVQAKHIEHMLLKAFLRFSAGIERVEICYNDTGKNKAARKVLDEIGFQASSTDTSRYEIPVEAIASIVDTATVHFPEAPIDGSHEKYCSSALQ